MPRKRPAPRAALSRIDPKALAEFQAGIRKRYSNEEIGLEVLCTKAGTGTLTVNGAPLLPKEAKPLPASD